MIEPEIETISKEVINVMWFKRDLRLRDNLSLYNAIKETSKYKGRRLLLLYIFEPSLVQDPHYDIRHWRFVLESLSSINAQLKLANKNCNPGFNLQEWPDFKIEHSTGEPGTDDTWRVHVFYQEVIEVFKALNYQYNIAAIFSHKETGLKITYDRDIAFAAFCLKTGIKWNEYINNGIIRRIKDRSQRYERWKVIMNAPQTHPDFSLFKPVLLTAEWYQKYSGPQLPEDWQEHDINFQQGGENQASHYLNTFLQNHLSDYTTSLSKPLESRTNSSRLSPYLAWGCLSTKQVFQAILETKKTASAEDKTFLAELQMFSARLRCQGSFVQSFECNESIEFEDVNTSFKHIVKNKDKDSLERWCNGQTGYPLVDACMRCLIKTGYLNFRMRALLISFLTHHLFQDWKEGAKHLAHLFTDFEPGIHYSQMQLQSGMGGHQIVRVYNPIKQSYDHDAKGYFIKQWVPELANCDERDIHEPWKMPPLQQQLCKTVIGINYPFPIVDVLKTGKDARKTLYEPRIRQR